MRLRGVSFHLGKELGFGCAWTHQQHVNLLRSQFRAHCIAEAMQCKFARAVFAFLRHATMPENRADIHDDRLVPAAEECQGQSNQFDRREEVDFHDPPQASFVGARKGADRTAPRVVNEHIESAEPRLTLGNGSRAIFRLRHIGHEVRKSLWLLKFIGQLLQSLLSASNSKDVGTLLNQLNG